MLIQYPRFALRRETLMLAEVANGEHCICTPDGDIHNERLSVPPMSSVLHLDQHTTLRLSRRLPA